MSNEEKYPDTIAELKMAMAFVRNSFKNLKDGTIDSDVQKHLDAIEKAYRWCDTFDQMIVCDLMTTLDGLLEHSDGDTKVAIEKYIEYRIHLDQYFRSQESNDELTYIKPDDTV